MSEIMHKYLVKLQTEAAVLAFPNTLAFLSVGEKAGSELVACLSALAGDKTGDLSRVGLGKGFSFRIIQENGWMDGWKAGSQNCEPRFQTTEEDE